jgi:hypothetical protein
MQDNRTKPPDAFGYALFSGTATFLAFFLPVILWAMFINRSTLPGWIELPLTDVVLASCLYHGYYRAKTLAADLGAKGNKLKAWQDFFRYSLYAGLFILVCINLYPFIAG